jgi:Ca2+-dependent lipid-binding protein
MDLSGLSDPYCVFTLNEQVVKSKVLKKTLNPKWNEEFSL